MTQVAAVLLVPNKRARICRRGIHAADLEFEMCRAALCLRLRAGGSSLLIATGPHLGTNPGTQTPTK